MKADEPGALVLPTVAAIFVGATLLADTDHPVELVLSVAMAAIGVAWILVLEPTKGRRR